MRRMIVDRIERFVRGEREPAFDELALEAFCYQYERIPAYRKLCVRQGATPEEVADWREVPAVPALAFKSLALHAAEPREVFRSSGTTDAPRSVHHHPIPDLYRTVIEHSFPHACLRQLDRPPMLSLIPTREQVADSSLSFMIDHVIALWGGDGCRTAFGPRGIERTAARSFLAARQRDRRPTLVLATSLALLQLVEALERIDLRFRLPAGSRLFETGGFKGKTKQVSRADLARRVAERLGIGPTATVREYGMTELTSQFYAPAVESSAAGAAVHPDIFEAPPWVRVRILDPVSLEEAPRGNCGLIAVFDLANVGSAVHLLTEDLGLAVGNGFRLVGRAAGAELRGCSLTVEELTG